MEGKSQEATAAAVDVSVRSVRKWETGPLPSQTKERRQWRTRSDPFEAIWESKIVPLLEQDRTGELHAKTVLQVLGEECGPDAPTEQQLRTLQRRMRTWRACHGPGKEVYFEQEHPPGREAQMDFTSGNGLGITIAGKSFEHLIFQFVLPYSKWRWTKVHEGGETFEALRDGFQESVWKLGGCPSVARTDNLSAATHELGKAGGGKRVLTERYRELLDHYAMDSTRIRAGKPNENGSVEKANDVLKTALRQKLIVRGSRDFADRAAYDHFVADVRAELNARTNEKLAKERRHLLPLPSTPLPSYTSYKGIVVGQSSTVRVSNRCYSVPSRLKGHKVGVRVYAEHVEIWLGDRRIESMPRLRGERRVRIDYRHVIWSLVRKPGAFARYRYREELFPTMTFRRAYDALYSSHGDRADIEYVRILHLAASTMESAVERALEELLTGGDGFDYAAVKALAAPRQSPVPVVSVPSQPNLACYDELLAGGAA